MFEYNKFYFIDGKANNGTFNMDSDEYLLKKLLDDDFEFPVLRFYSWSEKTISIGYNQCTQNNINLPHVKRITGGQAVFHDLQENELTYSFLIKTKQNPKNLYSELGKIFIEALGKYSLKAGFGYSNIDYTKSFNCFESMTEADIVVNNIKVIGSAQRIKRKIVDGTRNQYILQHGSIKLDKIRDISGMKITQEMLRNDLKEIFINKYNIELIPQVIQ